jgi:nitroimidazol reductase NimA-like FMN-containing flavoprotein (pyridoxamine 5'-phosphate oxidase superfamily)
MNEGAVEILDSHRTMAISTLRPDGWPQTTFVGYANRELTLYFLIFRSSQKLANIRRDMRVSLAVGGDEQELSRLTAVYAAAHAIEITDSNERTLAWRLLEARHPNLLDFELPDRTEAAMMKAICQYVTVLDFRRGPGHTEELSVSEGAAQTEAVKTDDWGTSAVKPGMLRRKGS